MSGNQRNAFKSDRRLGREDGRENSTFWFSICLFVCLSVSVCLSVCLTDWLLMLPLVCMCFGQLTSLSVYLCTLLILSVCLSVCLTPYATPFVQVFRTADQFVCRFTLHGHRAGITALSLDEVSQKHSTKWNDTWSTRKFVARTKATNITEYLYS